MKKNLFFTTMFIAISVCVSAQDNKTKAAAKPTEKSEIVADNHLKKELQQKQLSAPPERIADATTTSPAKKNIKKKRRCGTKTPAKINS